EMAAALSQRHHHIRFIMIGEATRGEEFEADLIKQKINELNLQDKLILTGYREDVPALLSAMDIFVFPSYAEAFGLVLIEAMAMKLPVVTANCDGVLDIVIENQTGELVPPKNVSNLIQAVEKLILDRKLRLFYSENGYKRVYNYFSEARMLDQLEGLYHRLIQDA
ncbi:glycosyltransferase, partial [candidate division KSB1 bacterium]|nr:glycosyltransferase [candidate division KSB1 bacterium]